MTVIGVLLGPCIRPRTVKEPGFQAAGGMIILHRGQGRPSPARAPAVSPRQKRPWSRAGSGADQAPGKAQPRPSSIAALRNCHVDGSGKRIVQLCPPLTELQLDVLRHLRQLEPKADIRAQPSGLLDIAAQEFGPLGARLWPFERTTTLSASVQPSSTTPRPLNTIAVKMPARTRQWAAGLACNRKWRSAYR